MSDRLWPTQRPNPYLGVWILPIIAMLWLACGSHRCAHTFAQTNTQPAIVAQLTKHSLSARNAVARRANPLPAVLHRLLTVNVLADNAHHISFNVKYQKTESMTTWHQGNHHLCFTMTEPDSRRSQIDIVFSVEPAVARVPWASATGEES